MLYNKFMRYYRRYSTEQFVAGCICLLIYFLFRFFTSPAGKTLLIAASIILVIFLILRWLYLDKIYEIFSINRVQKTFVVNNTTIKNKHCTVILTPGQKIVVMDNNYNVDNVKRMFVIAKRDMKINKCWYNICGMFNETSCLDSLAAFFTIEINVNIITFDKKETQTNKDSDSKIGGSAVIEKSDKNISKKSIAEVKSSNNILKEDNDIVENKDESFDAVANISKIDVNSATAEELSVLPGVNIVGAKKIVEYRNLNGPFKSEDAFIKAAKVKEHFSLKIKSMIVIGASKDFDEANSDNEGRIVDL